MKKQKVEQIKYFEDYDNITFVDVVYKLDEVINRINNIEERLEKFTRKS